MQESLNNVTVLNSLSKRNGKGVCVGGGDGPPCDKEKLETLLNLFLTFRDWSSHNITICVVITQ